MTLAITELRLNLYPCTASGLYRRIFWRTVSSKNLNQVGYSDMNQSKNSALCKAGLTYGDGRSKAE